MISDVFNVGLVFGSFIKSKGALYKYARFKFISTTIVMAINLGLLGYGITTIVRFPHNLEQAT